MSRVSRVILFAIATMGLAGAARQLPSETERNRTVVTDFVRLFYEQKDVRAAFEKHVAADYIQHNPNIVDGRDAAIAALAPKFSARGARFTIQRIVVDGEFAVVHLHGQPDPRSPGGAVADIYRLKQGKIVEHWDVLQPIPVKSINPHPMF